MDAVRWIEANLTVRSTTSDEVLYQQMESQSGFSLPVIYRPFDPARRGHWHDRGQILDFALCAGPGHVMDLGPGDGWPSLLMAPYVRHVSGVDASERRVQACLANASRLAVVNFDARLIRPGAPLPFADESVDGATAASSLEQTPDPVATLKEIYRVLRPGGSLRFSYESLEGYRGGKEWDLSLWPTGAASCHLALGRRDPDAGHVRYWGLPIGLPSAEVKRLLGSESRRPEVADLTPLRLEQLWPSVGDTTTCLLRQPDAAGWIAWLHEAGFQTVRTTHSGGDAAVALFDTLAPDARPACLEEVDRLLLPVVRPAVELPAPLELGAPISATK